MLGKLIDIPSAVFFIQHAFIHILDRFAFLIIPYRQTADLKKIVD
jgi:hypothetical protein